MQTESLAEQELMEPNRLAAALQPRHVQHQHAMELLRRPQVSQGKLRERGHQATVPTTSRAPDRLTVPPPVVRRRR